MAFVRKDSTHALWAGSLLQVPEAVLADLEASININPVAGFSGELGVSAETTKVFGDMFLCSANWTGVTLAPGTCTANIALPVDIVGTFTSANQAAGAAAGAVLANGDLASGEITPVLGTNQLLLTMVNPTSGPLTPTLGVQVGFQYKLT